MEHCFLHLEAPIQRVTGFDTIMPYYKNELNQLKKSDSHLALGIFYARVGLVTESEREFQKLVQLNPQSELPRRLLQSVRNLRKAN
jgi:hypothetical protein